MMTHPQIRTLETRYAGCRFRSRLEARWALFFDRLGIPWEYNLPLVSPRIDRAYAAARSERFGQ